MSNATVITKAASNKATASATFQGDFVFNVNGKSFTIPLGVLFSEQLLGFDVDTKNVLHKLSLIIQSGVEVTFTAEGVMKPLKANKENLAMQSMADELDAMIPTTEATVTNEPAKVKDIVAAFYG